MAAVAVRGCGGVWRRTWQRGARGPGPAPRGQHAVACNARGGAVPAGKSGYGAGAALVRRGERCRWRWFSTEASRPQGVAAGWGPGALLGPRATSAGAVRRGGSGTAPLSAIS